MKNVLYVNRVIGVVDKNIIAPFYIFWIHKVLYAVTIQSYFHSQKTPFIKLKILTLQILHFNM